MQNHWNQEWYGRSLNSPLPLNFQFEGPGSLFFCLEIHQKTFEKDKEFYGSAHHAPLPPYLRDVPFNSSAVHGLVHNTLNRLLYIVKGRSQYSDFQSQIRSEFSKSDQ